MRRLTLGALILGGGTLLSLPFRRPALPDPSSITDSIEQRNAELFDDQSLELLVREVTEGVEVPETFHPHTDYSPPASIAAPRQLPLTYEDLAVPVDRDPFYEDRFNAAVSVAENRPGGEKARRVAELERTFAAAEFADQSIAHLQTGSPTARAISGRGPRGPSQRPMPDSTPPPRRFKGAQLASSASSDKPASKQDTGPSSILTQLPPPDLAVETSEEERQRQWIQQPD